MIYFSMKWLSVVGMIVLMYLVFRLCASVCQWVEHQQQTLPRGSVCPQLCPQDPSSWGNPQIPQHQVDHGGLHSVYRFQELYWKTCQILTLHPFHEARSQLFHVMFSNLFGFFLSERHFQRMNRLLQQAMFLEFTWSCMRRATDNTGLVPQNSQVKTTATHVCTVHGNRPLTFSKYGKTWLRLKKIQNFNLCVLKIPEMKCKYITGIYIKIHSMCKAVARGDATGACGPPFKKKKNNNNNKNYSLRRIIRFNTNNPKCQYVYLSFYLNDCQIIDKVNTI